MEISCIVNTTTECRNVFKDSPITYFNPMWNDDLDEPLNNLEEAFQFISKFTAKF
jgi:hypothetical protein